MRLNEVQPTRSLADDTAGTATRRRLLVDLLSRSHVEPIRVAAVTGLGHDADAVTG